MARPLTRRAGQPGPRALLAITALVVLVHALVLAGFSLLLRPPSLLKDMAPPFYTRSIAPETPPTASVALAPPAPAPAKPKRPSARMKTAHQATKSRAEIAPSTMDGTPEAGPQTAGAAAEPLADDDTAAPPWPAASEPTVPPVSAALAEAPSSLPASSASPAVAAATPPASAASAGTPAFLAQWPGDTRLRYRLGGNYRGELHGTARVLWQREDTRYHTSVQLDVGLLLSMNLSSQGEITAAGLQPGVYEEQVGGRRRGVRLGEDVRLNNGERVPRPDAVQDAASQFVELSQRLASGQIRPEPGTQIRFWLARPGGVDEWTYDVVGEETLHLPRLGVVRALHLKPRPLAKPRGPIVAEIWYAPSLQFLPVRIRLTQGEDTYIDLLVDSIDQR